MSNAFVSFGKYDILAILLRFTVSAIIGGLIGFERGRHGRAAGLRTHILVCVGACMTSLTSVFVSEVLGNNGDVFRISAQVISGIGFLGAGMIMVRNRSLVTGLTTAAGLWATAAIGVALGYGFYPGAIVAAVISFFSVTALGKFEKNRKNGAYVYVEIPDIKYTESVSEIIRKYEQPPYFFNITPPKSGYAGHIGMVCLIGSSEDFIKLKEEVTARCGDALLVYDINS